LLYFRYFAAADYALRHMIFSRYIFERAMIRHFSALLDAAAIFTMILPPIR